MDIGKSRKFPHEIVVFFFTFVVLLQQPVRFCLSGSKQDLTAHSSLQWRILGTNQQSSHSEGSIKIVAVNALFHQQLECIDGVFIASLSEQEHALVILQDMLELF